MKYDPVTQGLIPAVSGDDLIEAVPALREIAEVEVVEFSNVPSGHITPQMMFDLAKWLIGMQSGKTSAALL